MAWDITEDKSRFSLSSGVLRDITTPDVVEYVREHQVEITGMLELARSSAPYRRCKAGSALVAALTLCGREDEIQLMGFYDKLSSGLGLTAESSVYHLRERLTSPPERSVGLGWETEVMAITVKSWIYYRKNKPMSLLAWRRGGNMPERFPNPKGV